VTLGGIFGMLGWNKRCWVKDLGSGLLKRMRFENVLKTGEREGVEFRKTMLLFETKRTRKRILQIRQYLPSLT